MTDGVDHINIYSKGETHLGRALSNFAEYPIETIDGPFASIEGYWYWLGTTSARRDELRKVFGWQAKSLGRQLRDAYGPRDPAFRLKIVHAMATKLIRYPALYEEFRASTLPFKHYYVYNGKVTEPKDCRWIVETWEYLRRLSQASV